MKSIENLCVLVQVYTEMVEIATIEELENFDLFDRIKEVYDRALANGDLVFSEPTDVELVEENGIEFELKIVEGLAKRPNNRASEPGENPEVTDEVLETVSKRNPFLKPEPELTVIDSLFDDYRIILNKFPNMQYHFLLVTKEFEKQDTLLKPIELEIMNTILNNLNSKGLNFFSFFNSGPESGYSQFHKHIQFMMLPKNFIPYPTNVVKGVDFFIPNESIENKRPLIYKKAGFKHYILKLKTRKECEDEEEYKDNLAILYMYLIKRVMNLFKEHEILSISYNLLMMKDWIMIIPRRNAKFKDIWQNSLGFMGLFCLKNDELKQKVKQIGMLEILKECGFEMEEDEHLIVYNEYGY